MPGEGLELGLRMTVEEAIKKRPPVVVETVRTRESPMTGFGTTLAEARTLVRKPRPRVALLRDVTGPLTRNHE